jgi:hypothetical protein
VNYSTLFQTIQAYAENNFPDTAVATTTATTTSFLTKDQVDTFITQAEQRVFNSVQLPVFRKNVIGNCTASNKYLSAPSDWLATFSLSIIDPTTQAQEFLLNKDVEFIREAYPILTYTGKPQHYAIFKGPTVVPGDQSSFILGPTPDLNYDFELHYFYYPISITAAASGETWLGNNFDSVLLYGSLLEAYAFMKGEQDVNSNYISRYNEALAMLKQLGEGKNRQDMYRTVQARYPVR